MFNNEQSFGDGMAYRPHVYGLGIGKYQIINTPTSAPMAILNNDCSDNIIYNGNDKVILSPQAEGYARQSEGYSFYTGTINVTVKGDFGAVIVSCNGEGLQSSTNQSSKLFRYSETCKDYERPENTIYSLTQTLIDLDTENGTMFKINRCIFLLNNLKKKIYAQKKNLEEIVTFALNNSATINNISTDEGDDLLSIAVGNIGTWTEGTGARRMYKGEDNIAIIDNPNQKDGSNNIITGGAKFTKKLIDNFLKDLEKNLNKIVGKANLDKKIQDKLDKIVGVDSSGNITINSTDNDTLNNLERGDVVFVDNIEGIIDTTNNSTYIVIKPIAEANKSISQSNIKGKITNNSTRTISFNKHATMDKYTNMNKIKQIK
jgi:hypothetical protein